MLLFATFHWPKFVIITEHKVIKCGVVSVDDDTIFQTQPGGLANALDLQRVRLT